jgi:hypothetical protein
MTRKDFTQTAFDVFKQATGEQPKQPSPAPKPVREASRKGGLKGGASRAAKLTPEQRSEIARVAAQARWKKTP